jgi:hypothetical protein
MAETVINVEVGDMVDALKNQRNSALDEAAASYAHAQTLLKENARLKARIAELEAGAAPRVQVDGA